MRLAHHGAGRVLQLATGLAGRRVASFPHQAPSAAAADGGGEGGDGSQIPRVAVDVAVSPGFCLIRN